jgi:hypothetical protein
MEIKMIEEQKKSGRPPKYDAEYFPHYCNHNRTLEIIVHKYGNEGYGFYYRLQELLGKTPHHGYDASSTMKYEYLQSKTGVDHEKVDEIIALLCEFGELDGDLWRKKKVIWWYAFVKSLKELYKKRKNQLPEKDDFMLVLLNEEGFRGTKEEEEEFRGTEIHKVK